MAKRPKLNKGPPKAASDEVGTRGIHELDRFSHADLDRWNRLSKSLDILHSELYYGFESQRSAFRQELIEALLVPEQKPFEFENWCRIIPYRFALSPLSPEGSMHGVGGRFNVGRDIPSDVRSAWPALYLACDVETARREKFGISRVSGTHGLSAEDLALMPPASLVEVRVSGCIEKVFDLTDLPSLAPFCKLLARFKMPTRAEDAARKLHIDRGKVRMVRTPRQLQKVVMNPSWRAWPVQFEVPAHGQILASILIAAGYEAIKYPSAKSGQDCLAVFPQNIYSSKTWIEVADQIPPMATHTRIDMHSGKVEIDGGI
jgi:hypothetical protein